MEQPERIGTETSLLIPQHCGRPDCEVKAGSRPTGPEKTAYPYIFAIGRVEAHFPRLAVEKEFAQVTGRAETIGLTDRQALYKVLTDRQNRYLVRQLCWILTIEGLDTYILLPRDSTDYELLVEAIRPTERGTDLDVVIGLRGPMASPETCNGLILPLVLFDKLYSFNSDAFIKSIPRPEKVAEEKFGPAAEELFERIIRIADNAGASDGHRALNYLAVRYPAIYARAADAFLQDTSLTSVEVRSSLLSSVRKIVDVIFSYTNRKTDVVEKYAIRVDVTEEFPFLVNKLSPYFDH